MKLPVIHVIAALLLCAPLAAEQASFRHATAVQIDSEVIISILSSSTYQSERVTMSIFVGPKSDGGGPPVTGTITVRDGETIIFTGPYNSKEQRFMYRLPLAGLHTFTCAYSGDANYLPGTGTLSQLVTRATAFVSLFSDPDSPLLAGQSLTLQAAVIAAGPSGGVPSVNPNGGPVTFYDNGFAIGTAATAGCCTSITFQPSLGRHSYSATYNGNVDLDPSPMSFALDYTVYSLPCSPQAICGRRRAVGH
jgi:hypothetical protein